MTDERTATPPGAAWLKPTLAVFFAGVAFATVGVLSLGGDGGRTAGFLLLGVMMAGIGLAGLIGGLRVEARHHAVRVLRPHDDVVEVSLGLESTVVLQSAGINPLPMGGSRVQHVTASVGQVGVSLWTGGTVPVEAAVVPWSAVRGIALAAARTAGTATTPAVALTLPGGDLELAPRRGASGNGWASLDDVGLLLDRWTARRLGVDPGAVVDDDADVVDWEPEAEPEPDLGPDPGPEPDLGPDPEPEPESEPERQLGPDRQLEDVPAEPGALPVPLTSTGSESVRDRIRRLSRD